MASIKNNPNARNKGQQETTILLPKNFYGFNDAVWMSVTAENEIEAEKMIRASCNLTSKAPLTIKPMV